MEDIKYLEKIIKQEMASVRELFNTKFEQNEKEHKTIEDKQDHTNGDVSDLKLFRAKVKGALAVISVVLLPIIFLVIRITLSK